LGYPPITASARPKASFSNPSTSIKLTPTNISILSPCRQLNLTLTEGKRLILIV
jgi:hypothetical protein